MSSAMAAAESGIPWYLVYKFWQDFDLDGRRDGLDASALGVAQFQEESLAKRRDLAQATRKFKAKATEDVTKLVSSLLKQYQEEVDRLTKRAKHGEQAFLDLYQKLYEAPDPAAALMGAVEGAREAARLETVRQKLQQELEDYKVEAKGIKNQGLTIRKLEEHVRSLEAALQQKEQELENIGEARAVEANAAAMEAMRQREAQLTQMLAEAKESLASMQRLHQHAQDRLFEMQSRTEDSRAGNAAELEMAAQEMERAQQRMLALEAEKRRLEAQVQQREGAIVGGEEASAAAADDRQQLEAAQQAMDALREELAELGERLEEREGTLEARCAALRRSLEASEAHRHSLEAELAVRPTAAQLDELRKQLQALQAVQFGSVDEGAGNGMEAVLDRSLLAKVRRLEHDVTTHRLRANEATTELEVAQAQIASLDKTVKEQLKMIAGLEDDLLAAEQAARGQDAGTTVPDASGNGMDTGTDHSMLQVLCAQRDRFRNRAEALHEEMAQLQARLAEAEQQAAAARADNVALVERLKYVQSFSRGTPRTRPAADLESGMAAESRYAVEYERALDPFSEFRGRERDQTRRRMNVADRAMHGMGRLVVGNKWARLLVFGYIVLLHVLIFGVLTRVAHQHHDQLSLSAAECERHHFTAGASGLPARGTGLPDAGRSA